jgi:NAD-dependent deacetylase
MVDLSASDLRGIRCAADILRESTRATVLTGAGISTPSGIPDFRSPESGLWERYDPFEVASLSSFRYHPEKFYNWIRPLARQILAAEPNEAHTALARLEEAGRIETVITQNIDGLHQRAGSRRVLEVHGSLDTLTCVSCYHSFPAQPFSRAFLEDGQIPRCPDCNHVLKPDVVLFGEQLPFRTWLNAQEACRTCDLLIIAGSSLEVLPVAGLPMRSLENGARLILINQSQTYLDVRADVILHQDVVDIIPMIADEVLSE